MEEFKNQRVTGKNDRVTIFMPTFSKHFDILFNSYWRHSKLHNIFQRQSTIFFKILHFISGINLSLCFNIHKCREKILLLTYCFLANKSFMVLVSLFPCPFSSTNIGHKFVSDFHIYLVNYINN